MPSASAPSVPGRSCRCTSALAASCVRRGSTTISLMPRSSASIRWPAAGVLEWKGLALQTSRQSVRAHVGAGHLAVHQLERHGGRGEAGARLGTEVGRAVLEGQTLHEGTQLLGVADVEDGRLRPALGLDALEVGGDLLERLVPRDRLELAGAARTGAPQRREQPVLVVDVLARRRALGAQRAAVVGVLARALDLDDAAVAHGEVEAALRRGIADRADRLAHLDAGVRPGDLGLQPAFRVVHVIPSLTTASAAPRSRAPPDPRALAERAHERSRPAHVAQQIEAYQPAAAKSRAPRGTPPAPRPRPRPPRRANRRRRTGARPRAGCCRRPGRRKSRHPGHREPGDPPLPSRARPERRDALAGQRVERARDVAGGEQAGGRRRHRLVDVDAAVAPRGRCLRGGGGWRATRCTPRRGRTSRPRPSSGVGRVARRAGARRPGPGAGGVLETHLRRSSRRSTAVTTSPSLRSCPRSDRCRATASAHAGCATRGSTGLRARR